MIGFLNSPAEFERAVRERMKDPLPGSEAQDLMTSRSRMPLQDYLERHPDHRISAVMMLVYPINNIVHTLIIQRPAYEGVHSGQLALPGGKTEDSDPGILQTALRETEEEIGVRISEQSVLGALTPLYIPPSNFLVHPFVAWMDQRPAIVPDVNEVQDVIEVPVSLFLDESIKDRRRIVLGPNRFLEAPCYVLNGKVLWGATAMMFSELEAILKGK